MEKQLKKLFGTDGIRGEANVWPMTPDVALAVGRALAFTLPAGARVLVAGDTRPSRGMLECALAAGLASGGADALLAGTLPTPAVAVVLRALHAHAGIAITASHNPASDNGIKIFNADGCKLDDEQEKILEGEAPTSRPSSQIGTVSRVENAADLYVKHILASVKPGLLEGVPVVVDCANGAASEIAPKIFNALGARAEFIACEPEGMNINDNCGALHPEKLLARVRETQSKLGIALDGDADRLVLCDAHGIADGDRLLAAAAASLDAQSRLAKRTVVVTSVANLGLHDALAKRGIRVEVADVGERYVIERMRAGGFNFGGETSGHLVFGDHATSGDGILAALQFASLMGGATLSEWLSTSGMTPFPQCFESFRVREKIPFEQLPLLQKTIRDAETNLGSDGRVMVRYSGTENKIRVLVEARTEDRATHWMAAFRAAIGTELQ